MLAFAGKMLRLGPVRLPKAYERVSAGAGRLLLLALILVPPLVELGLLHPDLIYSFCQICPGGNLLPALAGQTRRLAVDASSEVSAILSSLSLALTGATLGLGLAVARPWCLLCPVATAQRIMARLRLVKVRRAASKCAS